MQEEVFEEMYTVTEAGWDPEFAGVEPSAGASLREKTGEVSKPGALIAGFAHSLLLSQTPTILRILRRRVPWPSLQKRPERSGLRLRWDAIDERSGRVLVTASEWPFQDAAYVLLEAGEDPESLITMRDIGETADNFTPMPLKIPAARGARRAKNRKRVSALRATRNAGT